jgi:Nucleotidyl transferase AbiEii toxin, Type IV TA system
MDTMLVDTGLTFREIVMNDPLPKGAIQQAVVNYLVGRDDAAVFGAMAVNVYIDERRMTEDVDIVSTHAGELAEAIQQLLNEQFHIAVRIREVRDGVGFRLYQIAKPKNRHLVDVRPVDTLPPTDRIDGVLVVTPAELIAGKVLSCVRRKGRPKSFTDRRDLAHMLLRYPELKVTGGVVQQRLEAQDPGEAVLAFWRELVAEEIAPEVEDDEFS